MKINEKNVENLLKSDEIQEKINTVSYVVATVQVLIQKNIVTMEEFDKINEQIKELMKEQIVSKIKETIQEK